MGLFYNFAKTDSLMYKRLLFVPILLLPFMFPSCHNTPGGEHVKESPEKSEITSFFDLHADKETQAVRDTGDAADDPAVWIHPEDPGRSLILGTNKQRGLAVYDLSGDELFFSPIGKVNNVDVRYNFPLGDEKIDIVAASNRNDNSIALMQIDESGTLKDIADTVYVSSVDGVYGICLYHNKAKNTYYVIINSKTGQVEQWLLKSGDNMKIHAELVRNFDVGGLTEGCVADDELGVLYIGQEDHGIWRYYAEPDMGNERTAVDDFNNPMITADIEGLTIYYGAEGSGYLIASSQGNNSYSVYSRTEPNEYLGSFRIIDEKGGIDGTEDTDGIDVTNLAMGEQYPNGFFIAQDGYNYEKGTETTQNFKMISWEKIAEAFTPPLLIDNSYNIRD